MECLSEGDLYSLRKVTNKQIFFLYLEISLSSVVSGIMPARYTRKHPSVLRLCCMRVMGIGRWVGVWVLEANVQGLKCNYVFVPGC